MRQFLWTHTVGPSKLFLIQCYNDMVYLKRDVFKLCYPFVTHWQHPDCRPGHPTSGQPSSCSGTVCTASKWLAVWWKYLTHYYLKPVGIWSMPCPDYEFVYTQITLRKQPQWDDRIGYSTQREIFKLIVLDLRTFVLENRVSIFLYKLS